MVPKILITERFSLTTLIKMQKQSEWKVIHDLQWYQKPNNLWADVNILIIRSQTKVDKKLLNLFPQLQLVITATAGFDHIDLKLCQALNIRCFHCPSSHTASTAELTWALLLACARRLHEARTALVNGDWDRNKIVGSELSSKSLGIIGLGRVGTHVAQIARAFQMKLFAYDPYQNDEVFDTTQAERVSLEELLSQSDVVSLHVPLTPTTRHLMGDLYLESLSPDSILINTCRGPVIHENALIQKLQGRKIGAVGLDVFEYEPLSKDSKLFNFSNVIMTPHIGATTKEAFEKASEEAFTKVLLFLSKDNTSIKDELPPRTQWWLDQ